MRGNFFGEAGAGLKFRNPSGGLPLELVGWAGGLIFLAAMNPLALAQQPDYLWLSAAPDSDIAERFPPPEGFLRDSLPAGSFGDWLRHLPLKSSESPVRLFNGHLKQNQSAHAAVIDLDVGHDDLQQCADAVIRLRAEYLFSRHRFAEMRFHFTSGDRADFDRWICGYRSNVHGNRVSWVLSASPDSSYKSFRDYLRTVFTYAGTRSLEKELKPRHSVTDMQVGDVFIAGGSPGHAVIVVDMAVNPHSGEKVFLLAQSFMAAQDLHVLKNPQDPSGSPWYPLDFGSMLGTPEWVFHAGDLRYFESP